MQDSIVAGIGARDSERVGDWICTFSGNRFWPLDARPDDFDMHDIAHSLSQMCRFNGHTRYFYSVAQHCVHVAQVVEAHIQRDRPSRRFRRDAVRWGLLHDATEAYICDVPRPLKHSREFGDAYHDIERKLEAVLCEHFGIDLTTDVREVVKWADNVLLYAEANALMPRESVKTWHWPREIEMEAPRIIITPWTPCAARERFLQLFREHA